MDSDDYMCYSGNFNPSKQPVRNEHFLSSDEFYKSNDLFIKKSDNTDFRAIYGKNIPSGVRGGGFSVPDTAHNNTVYSNKRPPSSRLPTSRLPTSHQYIGPPPTEPIRQQTNTTSSGSVRKFRIPENSVEFRTPVYK